jgi:hypothetical protein
MIKCLLSIFFIILFKSVITFGQNVKIKIVNNLNESISFTTIVVTDQRDSLIDITSTDNSGYFLVPLLDSIYLDINAIGFAALKIGYSKNDLLKPTVITMNPITQQINEIVIKANRQSVHIKSDTISINVKEFRDGTEKKLVDLFEKIPGIKVTEKGSLTYYEKPINKLLVDGDNIFENNYERAIKGITDNIVESLEVYTKYSDNPVLSKAGLKDEVALNIKVAESFKNTTAINLEAATGLPQVKYESGINVFQLGRKVKSVSYGNMDNTNAEVIKEETENDEVLPNIIALKPLSIATMEGFNLPNVLLIDGKVKQASFQSLSRVARNAKLNFGAKIFDYQGKQSTGINNIFLNTGIENLRLDNDLTEIQKEIKTHLTYSQVNADATNSIDIKAQVTSNNLIQDSKSVIGDQNDVGGLENLDKLSFKFYFVLNHIFKNGSLFRSFTGFQSEKDDSKAEFSNFNNPALFSFFLKDSLVTNSFLQDRFSNILSLNHKLEYLIKSKIKQTYSISLGSSKKNLTNFYQNNNAENDGILILRQESIKLGSLFYIGNDYKSLSLNSNYTVNFNNDSRDVSHFPSIRILAKKVLTTNQTLSSEVYSFKRNNTISEVLNIPTLMAPNQIEIGPASFKTITNYGLKMKYAYFNVLEHAQFSALFSLSRNRNEDFLNYDFRDGLIFLDIDNSNNKSVRELNISARKALFRLRTTIGSSFSYLNSNELFTNFNTSGKEDLVRYKFGINFKSNYKWLEINFQANRVNSVIKNPILTYNFKSSFLSNSLKFKKGIFIAELKTIMRGNQSRDNKNAYSYHSANLSILKLFGKDNISLDFNVYNLTNNKEVETILNSQASTTLTQIPTNGRVIMIKLIYN